MSESDTILDTQTRHLLDVIERSRRERCLTLVNEAEMRSRELVKQAHAKARRRMHQDILETRENLRHELASAQARRETRLRHLLQQADRRLLEQTWQPLQDSLRRRWQRADERGLWVDRLVDQARATLLATDWQVEYPADWPVTEREALGQYLAGAGITATFVADDGIAAGLRMRAGTTCVDATLDGLLRDRGRIEAILLAHSDGRRVAGVEASGGPGEANE